jgi:hypothetical protein
MSLLQRFNLLFSMFDKRKRYHQRKFLSARQTAGQRVDKYIEVDRHAE